MTRTLKAAAQSKAIEEPYFEVLLVDEQPVTGVRSIPHRLRKLRSTTDRFIYETVVVSNSDDAISNVLLNFNLQAVIIRVSEENDGDVSKASADHLESTENSKGESKQKHAFNLRRQIAELRPELDIYLITNCAKYGCNGQEKEPFSSIFNDCGDADQNLHMCVLGQVQKRYETPIFDALKAYSQTPVTIFHALPISRGNSVLRSKWIQDMVQFYGPAFLSAETSTNSGRLDSLLEPIGSIKKAQELAAQAFGAQKTFFITNGTSTANKVVVQALVQPGDIVLVDRNCHKSHHYGIVLTGAQVIYLNAYPLHPYSIYGAVPLKEIKEILLTLRDLGELNRVRLILLTNCTFDGLVYDVKRVMEECLAIKPDLIFLWDEAWFAFATFHPMYRKRTGMNAAAELSSQLATSEHRSKYARFEQRMGQRIDKDIWLSEELTPNPDTARVRVYVTQSTHKTLSAVRQGSMIHIFDQDFEEDVGESFYEAYKTHTSTSPNFQILASLDIARRQAVFEGYELVQQKISHATRLREEIKNHPLLNRYFAFLSAEDLVPHEHRGNQRRNLPLLGGAGKDISELTPSDEFMLDPTRITLYIGNTGVTGEAFRNDYLMAKLGVQINKTSRNTVLFMTSIGTTRGDVDVLIQGLVDLAYEFDQNLSNMSEAERLNHTQKVETLTQGYPLLPEFSGFHQSFRSKIGAGEGDLRAAYYKSHQKNQYRYVGLDELKNIIDAGHEPVSAAFVTPYPPGFPILVPGQVINKSTLAFMEKIDSAEIHGYKSRLGFRILNDES